MEINPPRPSTSKAALEEENIRAQECHQQPGEVQEIGNERNISLDSPRRMDNFTELTKLLKKEYKGIKAENRALKAQISTLENCFKKLEEKLNRNVNDVGQILTEVNAAFLDGPSRRVPVESTLPDPLGEVTVAGPNMEIND